MALSVKRVTIPKLLPPPCQMMYRQQYGRANASELVRTFKAQNKSSSAAVTVLTVPVGSTTSNARTVSTVIPTMLAQNDIPKQMLVSCQAEQGQQRRASTEYKTANADPRTGSSSSDSNVLGIQGGINLVPRETSTEDDMAVSNTGECTWIRGSVYKSTLLWRETAAKPRSNGNGSDC